MHCGAGLFHFRSTPTVIFLFVLVRLELLGLRALWGLLPLTNLAAQCEIPAPHVAQYRFKIVSQWWYHRHVALFSDGIAQVLLRRPLLHGEGLSHAREGVLRLLSSF